MSSTQIPGPLDLFFAILWDLWSYKETKWWSIIILIFFIALAAFVAYVVIMGLVQTLHISLSLPKVPGRP